MQSKKTLVMIGILFLSAAVARAEHVTADYDHTVNFSKYKTFMWMHKPETKEAFMQDRIMATVNQELTGKGYHLVTEGADLAVAANLASEEKHTWETYYDGSWGWGGGWSSTTEKTYEVGTLTVDVFDAQSRKLVWQGVATDELSRNPEKRTRDNTKEIEKMFKEFPFLMRQTLLQRFPVQNSLKPVTGD